MLVFLRRRARVSFELLDEKDGVFVKIIVTDIYRTFTSAGVVRGSYRKAIFRNSISVGGAFLCAGVEKREFRGNVSEDFPVDGDERDRRGASGRWDKGRERFGERDITFVDLHF